MATLRNVKDKKILKSNQRNDTSPIKKEERKNSMADKLIFHEKTIKYLKSEEKNCQLKFHNQLKYHKKASAK